MTPITDTERILLDALNEVDAIAIGITHGGGGSISNIATVITQRLADFHKAKEVECDATKAKSELPASGDKACSEAVAFAKWIDDSMFWPKRFTKPLNTYQPMSEDYEIEDFNCPKCGHTPLHSRTCTNWCDDGYIDESEDDPINFYPGESERKCQECKGTGVEIWCPSCGENLSGHHFPDEEH